MGSEGCLEDRSAGGKKAKDLEWGETRETHGVGESNTICESLQRTSAVRFIQPGKSQLLEGGWTPVRGTRSFGTCKRHQGKQQPIRQMFIHVHTDFL